MKYQHPINLLFASISLLTLVNGQAHATEIKEWSEIKPAGGHFSVKVPERVDMKRAPKVGDIELRSWSVVQGDRSYNVVAMHSLKGDFSPYLDRYKLETIDLNGEKFKQMVSPNAQTEPALRRLFYIASHHAVMFEEKAPDVPQTDDPFFKSIQVEKEKTPHFQQVNCDNRFYILLPANFERSGNMWRAFDENNKYLALEYWESDPTSQLKTLEQKAEKAGTSALNAKKTVQGFDAWEFTVGENHKYLVVKCPRMYYVFHCELGNSLPEAINSQNDFFKSIVIDKDANHPNF